MRIALSLTILAAGALLLVGCAEPLSEIKGTVTVDGQPVEDGAIRFDDAEGNGPTAGDTIKAGQYAVKMRPGRAKVSFIATKVVGKKALYGEKGPFVDIKVNALPSKYSAESTDIIFVVPAGKSVKDWELTSK